jgi:N-acetylneuraminic acid mutarotase
MPCLGIVDTRALLTLLVCTGVARALIAVPTTLGPPGSSIKKTRGAPGPALVGLTFAERIAYQRAIEEVRWRHRIWPKGNPQTKPPLDVVISRKQIEHKVADYLRKSQLVTDQRDSPISASELQAELDRMASDTRQPEVLRELFEALGNDPLVIVECLARPIVAERLLSGSTIVAGLPPWPRRLVAADIVRSTDECLRLPTSARDATYKLPEISTDCTDNTWTPTNTVNAPDARDAHTVLWTGTEMIIWGGSFVDNGGGHYLNSGGRYDPVTDTWAATSSTNAPTARSVHSAVWTGTEMIVWGGYDGTNELNTGGRYNPVTDSWVAISTLNAPFPRVRHTALWTGSEMIVWGGYGCDANCNLNSGGRYNPTSDSWTATSTTNAPEARWYHTVEWTGTKMIIWGGTNDTFYLNTGGRYDPDTDTWTATRVPNDVRARVAHTAVWTGNEMIVWGGTDSTFNDCNTGGRYNPSDDSWLVTSVANAPSPRESHSAVWTGTEMIIWGGIFCFPCMNFNDGGRYDPGNGSWVSTSTANAPHPRDLHTAVWTGSEMIVWGGGYFVGNNFIFLNTGGIYCAQPPPTPTPTPTATASLTPTATPTATATARPTLTPTPTATATATATPTATPTPRATATARRAPSPRNRPTPPPRPQRS